MDNLSCDHESRERNANRFHAGLFQVDVSTEDKWVSQQPVVMEQRFNFLNTLPWGDKSICNIILCLH